MSKLHLKGNFIHWERDIKLQGIPVIYHMYPVYYRDKNTKCQIQDLKALKFALTDQVRKMKFHRYIRTLYLNP